MATVRLEMTSDVAWRWCHNKSTSRVHPKREGLVPPYLQFRFDINTSLERDVVLTDLRLQQCAHWWLHWNTLRLHLRYQKGDVLMPSKERWHLRFSNLCPADWNIDGDHLVINADLPVGICRLNAENYIGIHRSCCWSLILRRRLYNLQCRNLGTF